MAFLSLLWEEHILIAEGNVPEDRRRTPHVGTLNSIQKVASHVRRENSVCCIGCENFHIIVMFIDSLLTTTLHLLLRSAAILLI